MAAFRRYRSGGGRRFRTMVPLGIYCPPKRFAPWQLGRADSAQWRYDSSLADAQAGVPVERRLVHFWDRIYVLLYRWIDGIDLEEAARCGAVTESALRASTSNIAREVLAAGFAVLDHKARHVIVRPDRARVASSPVGRIGVCADRLRTVGAGVGSCGKNFPVRQRGGSAQSDGV